MRSVAIRTTILLALLAAVVLGVTDVTLANGEVRETEFSTSLSEATGIVRIVVAIFGGVIGVLGIIVALKGVGGTADVSASLSKKWNVSMKRVSQGVVLTLIGAAVLIGALYFLPEKRSERVMKGNEITIEHDGGKTRKVMKK